MEVPRIWRERKQRYSLVGQECPHCDEKLFPPRDVCPSCGGETRIRYNFTGNGKVFSTQELTKEPVAR